MVIKVLGPGCAYCQRLESVAREATKALNIDAEFVSVTDVGKIMLHGVFKTPALVANNKVVVSGRIPSLDEMKVLLSK